MENFITNYILPLLGSLLATLVAILLAFLTAWIKKKTGLELQQAETDRLLRNIEEAIQAVEEKVRADVKVGLPKWTSELKYRWVLDYIGNKFPHLTQEEADKKIHAVLNKLRCNEELCDQPPVGNWTVSNIIPSQVGSGV